MTDDPPFATVDAMGLLCPLPVVRTRQAIARVPAGAVVELWADDEAIVEDLPAWCAGTGHELLGLEPCPRPDGRHAWRGRIRKTSMARPDR